VVANRIVIALLLMFMINKISPADQPVSRIVFGSCIKQDLPVPILYTMRKERPDLLLFIGDNIYADTEDMQVMRDKYAKLAANRDFQSLRAACPTMATWDDHDYGVDDGGADYAKRDDSQTEFLDFWQVPEDSPRRARQGIYDARIFGPAGQRLQVIVLDTRYFRSPLKTGTRRVGGPYYPDRDESKTMLGDAQWQWLEQQLRQPAELRLIVSSIQFLASAAGQETWANLPRERQRLLDLIKTTKAAGVFFVSGDRHWSELSMINDASYPIYDLTSSSFNQIHPRGTPTENLHRISETTYHRENYGLIKINWQTPDPQVTMQIKDIEGGVRIETEFAASQLR
jgi:alkaline phosphatase D